MASVGRGKSTRRSTMRFSSSTRARPSAAVERRTRMLLTSPPAQKWPPAPVRRSTRTAPGGESPAPPPGAPAPGGPRHELLSHREVDRVARLRTVEGDGGDRARPLDDQRLVAHGNPPVWSTWGPRHGPQTPKRSSRPGGAGALLDIPT